MKKENLFNMFELKNESATSLFSTISPMTNSVGGGGLDDFIKNNFIIHQTLILFQFLKQKLKFPLLKFSNYKKLIAFSLVELMISLITISCIAAAFAPVVSKKLKANSVSVVSTDSNLISDQCQNGGDRYGPDCELCTPKYCIKCNLECPAGKYVDTGKCACKECSEKYEDTCKECDSKTCTLCKTGYYLKGLNGKTYTTCQKCGTTAGRANICIDGINEQSPDYCDNPPSGYFCKGDKLASCPEKYASSCERCDSNKCTHCAWGSRVNTDGVTCKSCAMSGCCVCDVCNYQAASCAKCNSCCAGHYLYNGTCTPCASGPKAMTNCSRCSGNGHNGICDLCAVGYYRNGSGKCSQCTLSNCIQCANDKSTQTCESCYGGYYVQTNGACGTCSSKYGSNCVSCNTSKCLGCSSGYKLSANPSSSSACESSSGAFKCSDSNFMRIGNLCVTRRNMGDSPTLSIPSSVVVANFGETCYSYHEKCCWRDPTASGCLFKTSYSGCNRTYCTPPAGTEICEKFNYAGLSWRLPKTNEQYWFYPNSRGLGANGLQVCAADSSSSVDACTSGSCPGTQYNCIGSLTAIYGSSSSCNQISGGRQAGNGYGQYVGVTVRCVADLTGTDLE